MAGPIPSSLRTRACETPEPFVARVLRDAPEDPVHHLLKRPVVRLRDVPDPPAPPPVDRCVAEAPMADAKAGYDAGFEEGLRAGRDAAREQEMQMRRALEARAEAALQEAREDLRATFDATVTRVQTLASALHEGVAGRLEAAEEDMVVLCHEVVTRILGDAAVQPDVLRTLLQHASRELRGRPLVSVHVHPDDLKLLTQGMADDERALRPDGPSGSRKFEWVASPDVTLGGVVLHSPEGGLDARLETQLESLRRALLQNRAARKARRVPAGNGGAAALPVLAEGSDL